MSLLCYGALERFKPTVNILDTHGAVIFMKQGVVTELASDHE